MYDREVQPKGSTSVSMDARVYRVCVYRVCVYRVCVYRVCVYRVCVYRVRVYRVHVYRVRVSRVCVYRVCVVEQFLKSGIPISKIDSLISLLEEGSQRLTHTCSSHLSEYTVGVKKSSPVRSVKRAPVKKKRAANGN